MRLMPPLLELADMFNVILRRCRNSRADSDLVRGALFSTVPPSVPAWLPHIHAWQLDASGTAQAMRHTAREWLGGMSPVQTHALLYGCLLGEKGPVVQAPRVSEKC